MLGASPLINLLSLAKEKEEKPPKKSEQLCGKNPFQNIARITIQLLHQINVTLNEVAKERGSTFEIKQSTHSFLSARRK